MLHSSGDAREHFIIAIQTSITEAACHPHSSVGVFYIYLTVGRGGAEPENYGGHYTVPDPSTGQDVTERMVHLLAGSCQH